MSAKFEVWGGVFLRLFLPGGVLVAADVRISCSPSTCGRSCAIMAWRA